MGREGFAQGIGLDNKKRDSVGTRNVQGTQTPQRLRGKVWIRICAASFRMLHVFMSRVHVTCSRHVFTSRVHVAWSDDCTKKYSPQNRKSVFVSSVRVRFTQINLFQNEAAAVPAPSPGATRERADLGTSEKYHPNRGSRDAPHVH